VRSCQTVAKHAGADAAVLLRRCAARCACRSRCSRRTATMASAPPATVAALQDAERLLQEMVLREEVRRDREFGQGLQHRGGDKGWLLATGSAQPPSAPHARADCTRRPLSHATA
jgi:hypothetical protein